jgi:RNA polymerase sigma-70 factor (ECF subfamily)
MSAADPPTSCSSLLAGVRQLDPQAWQRLTAIYGPTVYGWARRQGLQPADAADLLQQVFASVAVNIGHARWDRPGDSFRGWLWTVFHSRLMDHYRQARRQPQAVGDTDVKRICDAEQAPTPETASLMAPDESAELVRRALAIIQSDFKEKTWQAFWRSTVDGVATSDVARDLGLSPAAVCMCRARVLARLRETLAGLGFDGDESGSIAVSGNSVGASL